MKRSLIIAVSAIIIVAAIIAMCVVPTAAYNNTSKTNTVFVIDENGKATVGVSYRGYDDVTTHAEINVRIEKNDAEGNTIVFNSTLEADGVEFEKELTCMLSKKGEYLCTVVYTVYGSGGAPDVIEFTSTKTCIKDIAGGITDGTPETPAIPPIPTVDFDGYTFVFASFVNTTGGWLDREVYAEEDGTGVLDAAINARNNALFENYNCFVKVVNMDLFVLDNDFMTNYSHIDIIGYKNNIHNRNGGSYINLHELDIDFNNPWWDRGFIEDMTVDRQIYGIVGAFSISSFDATRVLFFNKTVKEQSEELSGIDFYSLVEKNEWTIDKFFEIVKKAYSNTESGDIYGFASTSHGIRELYFGAGQSYSVKTDDEQGNSTITHAFTEAATVATNKIIEIFANESVYIVSVDALRSDFENETVLFSSDMLRQASVYAQACDEEGKSIDFGILPYPKLTSDQAEYKHNIDNEMIYLCVPKTCADRTKIADFLTLYAYHSYLTVYPEYIKLYENTYTTDAGSGEMVDIILNSRCYDFVDHFGWAGIHTEYINAVQKGENVFPYQDILFGFIEESALSYKEYLAKNND